MLKFNLKPAFAARGIDRPYYYLKQHGFTHQTANSLRNGKRLILNVKHLERLCELLWCEPNDLFEWQPSADKVIPDTHPLFNLKIDKELVDLKGLTATVPFKELGKVSAAVAKEIGDKKKE